MSRLDMQLGPLSFRSKLSFGSVGMQFGRGDLRYRGWACNLPLNFLTRVDMQLGLGELRVVVRHATELIEFRVKDGHATGSGQPTC